MGTRALEKTMWAGAVDPVVATFWPADANHEIRRMHRQLWADGRHRREHHSPAIHPPGGVSLLGIDSVMCVMDRRQEVWRRLATDMKPTRLPTVSEEITLAELPQAFATLLAGEARGRTVVKIA